MQAAHFRLARDRVQGSKRSRTISAAAAAIAVCTLTSLSRFAEASRLKMLLPLNPQIAQNILLQTIPRISLLLALQLHISTDCKYVQTPQLILIARNHQIWQAYILQPNRCHTVLQGGPFQMMRLYPKPTLATLPRFCSNGYKPTSTPAAI